MFEDVEVVPWETAEDLWGITYRDAATGFLHGQQVGTRDEAEKEAEELRRASRPGVRKEA
jgi:hypothetical protein